MKRGIELIAEKRSEVIEVEEIAFKVNRMVVKAEMLIAFAVRPSEKRDAITLLCEAGSLIAAKIDRVNGLK